IAATRSMLYCRQSPAVRRRSVLASLSHPKGPVQPRTIVIGIIIAIALIASWKIFTGRVDRTKPDAVATAFFQALKSKDMSAASKYWVPDGAEAWSTSATHTIDQMQGGSYTRFFEDIPSGTPVFV